jgi:beta-glucosidase
MGKTKIIFFVLSSLMVSVLQLKAQYAYLFFNPELPVEERIDHLLKEMTLDEKVACLSTNPDIPRLGVKGTGHVEGLHGLAQGGPSDWGQQNPQSTTMFPQAIGLAESWDRDVVKKVAEIEAYETRYMFQSHYNRGGLVVRAPNADLGRDVRWGRNEECYGEDAWFNAQMVEQFVKGLQGDDPDYWMTASLMKHFLANSNENGRDSSSSNFGERLFYEYYSYPFYKGVTEGGSRAYMAAYNAYNHIPMTVHPVMKAVTVNEWGQNGIICTDGGAFRMLVSAHRHYPDLCKAAAACIKAGINQFLDDYKLGVYGALANGYINESDLDSVLRGVFRVMIRLGQLDPPERVAYQSIGVIDTIDPWDTPAHRQAALEVTRKTIVLLKNENHMLPLDKGKIESIAVIGYLADTVIMDWYSGTPPYRVTPLQGIKNKLSDKVKISFAADNTNDAAVKLARQSEVVIVVAGNNPTCGAGWANCPDSGEGKEGVDRKHLQLSAEELIRKVYEANKNTIVVLQSSFPYAINWTSGHVPAILHLTHSSQETGNALADVLFGDYNPAGRLVQTWPMSVDDLPDMMDYDITKGRTYMYADKKPLFPFGFGLSYTEFEYSNLLISQQNTDSKRTITVEFDVRNTGHTDGEEVAQVYAAFPESKYLSSRIALRGFTRVSIGKGEQKRVSIIIPTEDLSYWNVESHCFETEEGNVRFKIGSSSTDIRLSSEIKISGHEK